MNRRRALPAILVAVVLSILVAGQASSECVPKVKSTPQEPEITRWQTTVRGVSRDLDVPADLSERVMYVESRGDDRAISPSGAIGLMQVMWFHWLHGENPWDPYQNIRKGVGLLRRNFELTGSWLEAARMYFGSPGDGYVNHIFWFDCESGTR